MPGGLQSSLGRHVLSGDGDADERARILARAAWHQEGLALIRPEWLGEWDRQQLIILADKVHGERRTG